MSTKHERAIEAAIEAGHQRWRQRGANEADAWAAGIAAYQRVMREPGPGEVRVRVCVAVNRQEDVNVWSASGRYDEEDGEVANWVVGDTGGEEDRDQIHWLEANVPAWQPSAEATVEGEVGDE